MLVPAILFVALFWPVIEFAADLNNKKPFLVVRAVRAIFRR
jgi:hypothetical protein